MQQVRQDRQELADLLDCQGTSLREIRGHRAHKEQKGHQGCKERKERLVLQERPVPQEQQVLEVLFLRQDLSTLEGGENPVLEMLVSYMEESSAS